VQSFWGAERQILTKLTAWFNTVKPESTLSPEQLVQACPQQPGVVECGPYILSIIKHIYEHRSLEIIPFATSIHFDAAQKRGEILKSLTLESGSTNKRQRRQ
jgi:hypothetical protein